MPPGLRLSGVRTRGGRGEALACPAYPHPGAFLPTLNQLPGLPAKSGRRRRPCAGGCAVPEPPEGRRAGPSRAELSARCEMDLKRGSGPNAWIEPAPAQAARAVLSARRRADAVELLGEQELREASHRQAYWEILKAAGMAMKM